MFHDSILNNIVLDTNVDMEWVKQVCKDCEILKDIEALPDGFETIIAEQGNNLSGGQKNRICLARALYMKKPILVIDEVTAGLDMITEKRVKENLKKYFRNKIVIIITHSPQFIIEESNVYSLENGKLLLN